MTATTVLSIVGPGRSGTTILANVLGEVEGVMSVGELRWLWRRGVLERRPCGCGHPPDACPVWSKVLARVATGSAEAAAVADAQDAVAGLRRRLRVLRTAASRSPDWPELDRVRAVTADLVSAVAAVTGARVVVDSSKRPQDAAVLAGLAGTEGSGVEHYVLHMVRDPGAVAFSWRREKTLRVHGGTMPMATRGLLQSLARWTENCLSAEVLRRHVPPDRWFFLRYEDFAAEPRATVERILAFLGQDVPTPFVDARTVELGPNHTVAGNPNRFRTGPVTIRLDDEWRRATGLRHKIAVRLLTWPLLLRYRIPLTGRVRATAA